MKGKLFLLACDAAAADQMVKRLQDEGWQVEFECEQGARAYESILKRMPDVVVVDLDHEPLKGHRLGDALHQLEETRHIPIIYAGGQPEDVATAQEKVPTAQIVQFSELDQVLAKYSKN